MRYVMLAELNITPLRHGVRLNDDLSRVLKIIDQSDLPYRLTPIGTCIEGEWDEIMALVKQCHREARFFSTYVLTTLRIEDKLGAHDKLTENVIAVERAAGQPLKH